VGGSVPYNPSDPTQQAFLSALAYGETGSNGGLMEGVGSADLSSAPVDQYGFPQWLGQGDSHAAGPFQFQPGTWDQLAAAYNLNFGSLSNQEQGAWTLASTTYQQKTGQSLEAALQAGDYNSVQTALASVWPSVTGGPGNPQGLAGDLASGTGAALGFPGAATVPAAGSAGTAGAGGIIGGIENFFVRFGLIAIGGIVVIVALWQLLANQGAVPSPGQTVKAAGEGIVALAGA